MIRVDYSFGCFDITHDKLFYSLIENMYTKIGTRTGHGVGLQINKEMEKKESKLYEKCFEIYENIKELEDLIDE